MDAVSETIFSSVVNLRDQPGSPERDFSASLLGIYTDFKRFVHFFVQVFSASLNGNTYGTKTRLSGDKSAGLG